MHAGIRDQNPFEWNDLPRWSSSPQPQCSKIEASVSRRRNGKSDVPVKQRGGWPKKSLKIKKGET